jgi:hypothetical protein
MERPITLQTHIDPVPEFIVKQVLRHLKMDKKTFFEALKLFAASYEEPERSGAQHS